MKHEVAPGYVEIMRRARKTANTSRYVAFEEIGPSEMGRPIPRLTLGDLRRDLPLLMVVGGTHGCEEIGRATAMAFAEWLAGAGARWLRKMNVVVIPCVNPDASLVNTYHNAKDVNVYTSYGFRRTATTAEGRAVEAVAMELLPDCFVDCHGLAGGAVEGECLHPTLPSNMGLQIAFAVAAEMDAAARKAGYPQQKPPMEGVFKNAHGSLCDKLASETNALCFTMETVEHYYPLADAVRSGLIRLQTLVAIGARRHDNQPYPGFPCDTLVGGPMVALMSYGATYRQRRLNRPRTIFPIVESFTRYSRLATDPGRVATLNLDFGKESRTFPEGLVFQTALDPRCKVDRVTYHWPDGRANAVPGPIRAAPARPSAATHYLQWKEDGNAIPLVRVTVAQPPLNGPNIVRIRYHAPFRAHDPLAPSRPER